MKAEDGKAVPVEVPPDAEKPQEKDKKKKKKEKKETTEDGLKNDQKADVQKRTIAGGVVVEDSTIGEGRAAKKGDTVKLRYIGKLTNGKEFDKNVSGKPVSSHP